MRGIVIVAVAVGVVLSGCSSTSEVSEPDPDSYQRGSTAGAGLAKGALAYSSAKNYQEACEGALDGLQSGGLTLDVDRASFVKGCVDSLTEQYG